MAGESDQAGDSILHIDNLSSMATGIFLAHQRNLGKILEMRSSRRLAAVCSRNRGSSEGHVPWISISENVPNHAGSPRQGHDRTDTPLHDATTALGCALELVRWRWNSLEGDLAEGPPNQRKEEELAAGR